MKVIEINVLPIREGEEVVANIITEAKKGEIWNRSKITTVTSGTPDSLRRIILQDHERIVIEGHTSKVVVYDREQGAAKIVDADLEMRAKQEEFERMQVETNALRETKEREVNTGLKAQAEAEVPKTNLGNPLPPAAFVPNPGNIEPKTEAELAAAKLEAEKEAAEVKPSIPVPTPAGSPSAPKVAGDNGQGAKGTNEVKK